MMGGASSKHKDSSHLPDVDVPYSENNYPPLKPPKTKKDIVYNPRLFTAIDAKASVTSREDATSYQTLIKHLTEGLQNDVQKVRSIFVWLASQEIMYDNFDDVDDVNTPLGYMRLIQDDRGTYEQFFALLCRNAKIPCMVVQGNIKSATYEVGDMDIECIYGYWNLVYLDGSWRIVNPKWAMVSIGNYSNERWHMIEKDGKAEQRDKEEGSLVYVYSQDDFYFLTDPEDHIYRCLPSNAKWQLLGEPWNMEKFLMVPLVYNDFFASGLKLPEGQQGIVAAKEGEVEINLQVTKGAKDIKYELYFDQKNKKKLHGESQMSRYVFVNNIRSTRSFFIRLQTVGKYMLTLLNDADTPLCDFRIDCSGVKGTCEPFPKNPAIGWGFNETARRAGLSSPSQESGIVTIDSKKSVDFTFKTQKGVVVKANLLHNEIPSPELEKHVNQHKDGDKLTVTVDIPTTSAKKEYALEINAKDSSAAKHRNVANYLLTTEKNKPHDIASRGTKSTTNTASEKHSTQTNTNGYIKKANPSEPSVDTQNDTVHAKGMFSFLSKKPEPKGPSSEETEGSEEKTSNGRVPSKQSQTENRDTKTCQTDVEKPGDHTKEPSQQSMASKLKNKTYSFKIKNKETSQGYESCDVSTEGVPNGKAVESNHKLHGSRRESRASRNANSLSPMRTPLNSPSPELITDYSCPARIKLMKEAYLNSINTKDAALYKPYARQKSSSPNPVDISTTDEKIKGIASSAGPGKSGKVIIPKQGNDIFKNPHPNTPASDTGSTRKVNPRPTRSQTGSTTLPSSQANTRTLTSSTMSSDVQSTKIPTPSQITRTGVPGIQASRTHSNNIKNLHQNLSKGSKTNERPKQNPEKSEEVQGIRQSLTVKENGQHKTGSGSNSPSRKHGVDRDLICADLKKAIESRQLSEINKLLAETGVHSPDPKLTELKEKAETVRTVMKRMNKYLHDVMAVNQGTIAEIHSYSHPKPIVHDVMRATFLLLGERGSQLRKWHYIQQLMRRTSKDGLIVRIQEFDVNSISLDLAEYVKVILDANDPDVVRLTSTGAGAFYIWVMSNDVETSSTKFNRLNKLPSNR